MGTAQFDSVTFTLCRVKSNVLWLIHNRISDNCRGESHVRRCRYKISQDALKLPHNVKCYCIFVVKKLEMNAVCLASSETLNWGLKFMLNVAKFLLLLASY